MALTLTRPGEWIQCCPGRKEGKKTCFHTLSHKFSSLRSVFSHLCYPQHEWVSSSLNLVSGVHPNVVLPLLPQADGFCHPRQPSPCLITVITAGAGRVTTANAIIFCKSETLAMHFHLLRLPPRCCNVPFDPQQAQRVLICTQAGPGHMPVFEASALPALVT